MQHQYICNNLHFAEVNLCSEIILHSFDFQIFTIYTNFLSLIENPAEIRYNDGSIAKGGHNYAYSYLL